MLVSVTAALLLSGYTMSAVLGQYTQAQPAYTIAYAAAEEQAGKYVVRAYNGKIALFESGTASTPIIETDIEVSALRAYDRRLLEDGIEVDSYEDVLRLFEDFGS